MSQGNAGEQEDMARLYAMVSDYFSLFSEPMRLQIMHAVCDSERNVSEVLAAVGGTQANVSRHLSAMHKAGVLSRRKERTQVYYAVADQNAVELCRTVCVHLAAKLDEERAHSKIRPRAVRKFMTQAV
ncbi:MAG: ArsR/SmtB family transcription factor [Burkholderiaceae bacterium]